MRRIIALFVSGVSVGFSIAMLYVILDITSSLSQAGSDLLSDSGWFTTMGLRAGIPLVLGVVALVYYWKSKK